jgi:hypothetical protein
MMARKSMFLESPNEEQTETVPDGLSPPTADITARPLTTVGMPTAGGETARDRAAKSRSVFGVDTVWEREMEKLRAIQEAEKKATDAATMERLARERERVEKRQSRWLKTRSMALPDTTAPQFELPNPNRMSVGIPDLAAGPGEKRITMFGDNRKSMMFAGDNAVNEEDEDAENDKEGEADADGEGEGEAADSDLKRPPTIFKEAGAPASPLGGVDKWFGSSDGSDSEGDEDNVPLSSVRGSVFGSIRGVSPNPNLNPTKKVVPPQPRLPAVAMSDDGSSDEDVPLSKVKELVHDSDEEVPLSKLRTSGGNPVRSKKTTPVSASGPKLDTDFGTDLEKTFANIGAEADKAAASPATPVIDEDDLPLFMRRQKAHEQRKKEQTAEEIEDDLPLAWKHAGAAQKQASQRQPQAQSMMYGPYMSGYGMPGMPMGGMGMGGMGMNGMGMGGGMPGSMGGHMSMMAPQMNMNMGYPADVPAPDPGSNIDNWRKQVGTSSRG